MRYSDSIRRAAVEALANLEEIKQSHQQMIDAIQPHIDRLQKILDDESVD